MLKRNNQTILEKNKKNCVLFTRTIGLLKQQLVGYSKEKKDLNIRGVQKAVQGDLCRKKCPDPSPSLLAVTPSV